MQEWAAAAEPKRKPRKERVVVKKVVSAPPKVRPQDLEQAVLEELSEEEILVVLQSLAGQSPQAQRILDDVRRRMEEFRLLDRFRQL